MGTDDFREKLCAIHDGATEKLELDLLKSLERTLPLSDVSDVSDKLDDTAHDRIARIQNELHELLGLPILTTKALINLSMANNAMDEIAELVTRDEFLG